VPGADDANALSSRLASIANLFGTQPILVEFRFVEPPFDVTPRIAILKIDRLRLAQVIC
jgi:hypothetical protein